MSLDSSHIGEPVHLCGQVEEIGRIDALPVMRESPWARRWGRRGGFWPASPAERVEDRLAAAPQAACRTMDACVSDARCINPARFHRARQRALCAGPQKALSGSPVLSAHRRASEIVRDSVRSDVPLGAGMACSRRTARPANRSHPPEAETLRAPQPPRDPENSPVAPSLNRSPRNKAPCPRPARPGRR